MVSYNHHQFRHLIRPDKFFSLCDKCFDHLLFLPTPIPFLVRSISSFRGTSQDETLKLFHLQNVAVQPCQLGKTSHSVATTRSSQWSWCGCCKSCQDLPCLGDPRLRGGRSRAEQLSCLLRLVVFLVPVFPIFACTCVIWKQEQTSRSNPSFVLQSWKLRLPFPSTGSMQEWHGAESLERKSYRRGHLLSTWSTFYKEKSL